MEVRQPWTQARLWYQILFVTSSESQSYNQGVGMNGLVSSLFDSYLAQTAESGIIVSPSLTSALLSNVSGIWGLDQF